MIHPVKLELGDAASISSLDQKCSLYKKASSNKSYGLRCKYSQNQEAKSVASFWGQLQQIKGGF